MYHVFTNRTEQVSNSLINFFVIHVLSLSFVKMYYFRITFQRYLQAHSCVTQNDQCTNPWKCALDLLLEFNICFLLSVVTNLYYVISITVFKPLFVYIVFLTHHSLWTICDHNMSSTSSSICSSHQVMKFNRQFQQR